MAFIEKNTVDRAIRKLEDTEAELEKAIKKVAETQQTIANIQQHMQNTQESAARNARSGAVESDDASHTTIRHLQAMQEANQITLADRQQAHARASQQRDDAQRQAGKLLKEIEVAIGKVEGNIARLQAQTGKPKEWLREVLATEQRELQKLRQMRARLVDAISSSLNDQSSNLAGVQAGSGGTMKTIGTKHNRSGSYFGSSGLQARESVFSIDQQLAADPFQSMTERSGHDQAPNSQRLDQLPDFERFVGRVLDSLKHFLR